jgi:hypothetical protein
MKQKEISDLKGFERSMDWRTKGIELMQQDGEQDLAQNWFLASIATSLIEIHRLMLLKRR